MVLVSYASDSVTNYTYDVENRLISVVGAHNGLLHYDPMGRLYKINAHDTGKTTYFLHSGDSLIAEYQSGQMTQRYVHGGGGLAPPVSYYGSSTAAAYLRFLHINHQGSVIAQSNNSGGVTNINTYDEYGVPGTGNAGRFSYTGQMHLPEIGLYHYRARMYNPFTGRFLQTDPIGYADQMNLYAYVHNDPLNLSDPTGMQSACAGSIADACYDVSVFKDTNSTSSNNNSSDAQEGRDQSCSGRSCGNRSQGEEGGFAEDLYNNAKENLKFGTTAKVVVGVGGGTSSIFTIDGVAKGNTTITLDYARGAMIQGGVFVRGDVYGSGQIDGFYQSGEVCAIGCIGGAWDYQGNFSIGTRIVFPFAFGGYIGGGYTTSGRQLLDNVTGQ